MRMGLRPCLTCNAPISTWAKRCPQCGEPHPHATSREKTIALVVMLVLVLATFAYMADKQLESDREFRQMQQKQHLPGLR